MIGGVLLVAHRVVVVDDLDGTEGARSVTFALDATTFTIDLAEHNLARLRERLAPFIAAGRRSAQRPPVDRVLNRAVREWAAAEGIPLNPLGRIPNSVLERFWSCCSHAPELVGRRQAV